jgi:hypothetical protein
VYVPKVWFGNKNEEEEEGSCNAHACPLWVKSSNELATWRRGGGGGGNGLEFSYETRKRNINYGAPTENLLSNISFASSNELYQNSFC